MLNMSPEMIHGIKTNTDTFMALSKIAFSSLEQLTALNLSTTRSSLEEGASSILQSNGALSSPKAKQTTPLAAGESTAAYFQGVSDIANETYHETTKLMTAYFASTGTGPSHNAGWLKGFAAFNGFGDKLSAFTEANSKAMADVTKRVANQANALSKKSA